MAKSIPTYREIIPTPEMLKSALALHEGVIETVYVDVTAIRMETELGDTPYVWRQGKWKSMTIPRKWKTKRKL